MEVVSAVLRDLYVFAFRYGFGFVSDVQQPKQISAPQTSHTTAQPDPVVQTAEVTEKSVVATVRKQAATKVGYSLAVDAPVYALPTRSFDGVILRLEYGQSFQIINTQGQWLQIVVGETKGWLHIDYLEESMSLLHPNFIVGQVYDADNKQTKALRINIKDSFSANDLRLPLQNVEYVTYKLQQKNRFIMWPNERPRIAGTWQRLLRGVRGVHLGVQPKTQSALEYIHEDNTGHIAFVDSVYPDGSVTISEVGFETEGVYSERTLTKDEWKELRPIFIEVA